MCTLEWVLQDYNYTNALKRNDDFFRNRPISHMGVMGIGRVHKLR